MDSLGYYYIFLTRGKPLVARKLKNKITIITIIIYYTIGRNHRDNAVIQR